VSNIMRNINTSTHTLKTAAEWLVRLQDSNLPPEKLLEWERWIEQNPFHRQAFDEVERLSRRTDALRNKLTDIPLPTAAELAEDDYSGFESVVELLDKQSASPGKVAHFVRGASRHWFSTLSAAAVLAGLAIGIGMLFSASLWNQPTNNQFQAYATAESEHRMVRLNDGSVISMGAKSSLSVNYTRDQRAVVLERGEALFTVARNPNRPFVVVAGSGTITAVGTAFNVRHDSERVVVTVTAGKVEIDQRSNEPDSTAADTSVSIPVSESTPTILVVGQQLTYDTTGITSIELTDLTVATAWQSGRLQYRGEALKYVIKDVNRYSGKEVIIVDKQVEGFLFTGSLFQNQADEWLKGLEEVFPVDVIEIGDNKVLLAARNPQ